MQHHPARAVPHQQLVILQELARLRALERALSQSTETLNEVRRKFPAPSPSDASVRDGGGQARRAMV
jgi:hypothetical protein